MGRSWSGLGPSGAVLGRSWISLGAVLGDLGRSGSRLGAILAALGRSWAALGCSWSRLEAILVRFKGHIGLKHVVFRLGFKYVWKMHVFSTNM